MIGVVAHQSGQMEAQVGVLGRSETRELAHGPKPAAVHRGMNTARIRRLAREAEVAVRVPIRQICFRVQPANGMPGNGGEFGLALGAFFQSRLKRVFLPGLFFGGGRSI